MVGRAMALLEIGVLLSLLMYYIMTYTYQYEHYESILLTSS